MNKLIPFAGALGILILFGILINWVNGDDLSRKLTEHKISTDQATCSITSWTKETTTGGVAAGLHVTSESLSAINLSCDGAKMSWSTWRQDPLGPFTEVDAFIGFGYSSSAVYGPWPDVEQVTKPHAKVVCDRSVWGASNWLGYWVGTQADEVTKTQYTNCHVV